MSKFRDMLTGAGSYENVFVCMFLKMHRFAAATDVRFAAWALCCRRAS